MPPPQTAQPATPPSPTPPADPGVLPGGKPSPTPPLPTPPADLDPLACVFYERPEGIWAFDLSKGQPRLVAGSHEQRNLVGPGDPWALAPDGHLLAMVRSGPEQTSTLSLIALPGGHTSDLGPFAGWTEAVCWSHDSSRLAYVVTRRDELTGRLRAQDLRIYDATAGRDGSVYRREYEADAQDRQGLWLADWLPGNEALYVVTYLEESSDPGTLCVLSLRGGGAPKEVSAEWLPKAGRPVSAAASRILLRRSSAGAREAQGPSALYVAAVAPDGTFDAVRLLTPAEWVVGGAAWSPDGQQVAVERLEPRAHGTYAVHLWLVGADGTVVRQLTADETYREEQPTWGPAGLELCFGRWRAARPEPAGIWALSPGAEPRLLDAAGVRPQAPVPPYR